MSNPSTSSNSTLYELIADQLNNITQLLYQSNTDQSTCHQIALAITTIEDLIRQLT